MTAEEVTNEMELMLRSRLDRAEVYANGKPVVKRGRKATDL